MLTTIFTPSLRLCLEAKECASYKEAIYDGVQQHFKSQKAVASLKIQTCTKTSTVITLANNQHIIHGQAKEFSVIIVYICSICQFLPNRCVLISPPCVPPKAHTFQPDYANSGSKKRQNRNAMANKILIIPAERAIKQLLKQNQTSNGQYKNSKSRQQVIHNKLL